MSELGLRFSLFVARDIGAVVSDCVDILLVSIVLYALLLLVKSSGAIRIGLGIVLLLAVYRSAKWLDLVTLHATLTTLLTPLLVFTIVVFQHDVRRGAQHFYRRPFFSSGRIAIENHLIEHAVSAATSLALRRIGALVVLERQNGLDHFVEAGTVLNATVTKELLYSVFIPTHENPLHDGAVIVRRGSIWQAGAFLPLSVNAKLDRNLGTRHRAALGISEQTDAVVIVVSEERGEVSLCVDGALVRNLDAALLRRILTGLFVKQRETKPKAGRGTQVLRDPETRKPPSGHVLAKSRPEAS